MTDNWTRRSWLAGQTIALVAFAVPTSEPRWRLAGLRRGRLASAVHAGQVTMSAEQLDPAPWQALAQQAVDAARAAGARYAEARLTRIVTHEYRWGENSLSDSPQLNADIEEIGVGVRALVDGYWGFSASAVIDADEVMRLARDAVGEARENAKGPPWTVDLGTYPVALGTWVTPVRIDPFKIPIEEKADCILYWIQCAQEAGVKFTSRLSPGWFRFVRQERVVATSEGSLFTQTLLESGGVVTCGIPDGKGNFLATQIVHGIDMAGAGWELMLDAKIDEQFLSGQILQEMQAKAAVPKKLSTIGKYTLVCDGATMASVVESTFGVTTQLDRALGYEANARGTSNLTDPLAMVGHAQVASKNVTVTANRSAPKELATVKWDEEGVVPEPFTLIKDGVVVDFQTTREQAAWLAPYYQSHGQPVRSHGCAATESAHFIPLQQMPNLSLEPSASVIRLEDLVADVQEGILVEEGRVTTSDFQARTGLLVGDMREIKNGRLGKRLDGGAVLYDGKEIWQNVRAVGGVSTQGVVGTSAFIGYEAIFERDHLYRTQGKGQPPQRASHSVRGVAATIPNQPLIDPMRKA